MTAINNNLYLNNEHENHYSHKNNDKIKISKCAIILNNSTHAVDGSDLIINIKTLKNTIAPKISQKDNTLFLTKNDAERIEPQEFWRQMNSKLCTSQTWTHFEIAEIGKIDRSKIQQCLNNFVKMPPCKWIEWCKKLSTADLWNQEDWIRWNPLFMGAIIDEPDILKKVDRTKIDLLDHRGCNRLHYASYLGNVDAVKVLLDSGADINAPSATGITPLCQAIVGNNKNVVIELLERGADFNKEMPNGQTVLELAIVQCDFDIIKLLIQKGAPVPSVSKVIPCDHKDRDYIGTFIARLCMLGHLPIVQFLLDNGAKKIDDPDEAVLLAAYLRTKAPKEYKTFYHLLCDVPMEGDVTAKMRQKLQALSVSHCMENDRRFKFYPIKAENTPISEETISRGSRYYLNKMMKATSLLKKMRPKWGEGFNLELLEETMDFASQLPFGREELILQRILSGKPTILPIGYNGHASVLLIWGNKIVHCDRGGHRGTKPRGPLFVHDFDPQKLDVPLLKRILEKEGTSKEHYEFFFDILPHLLNYRSKAQQGLSSQLEAGCPLSLQSSNNCTYSCIEGIVWAYMALGRSQKKGQTEKLENTCKETAFEFREWRAFIQAYFIECYLGLRVIRPSKASKHPLVYKLDSPFITKALSIATQNAKRSKDSESLIGKIVSSFKNQKLENDSLFFDSSLMPL